MSLTAVRYTAGIHINGVVNHLHLFFCVFPQDFKLPCVPVICCNSRRVKHDEGGTATGTKPSHQNSCTQYDPDTTFHLSSHVICMTGFFPEFWKS